VIQGLQAYGKGEAKSITGVKTPNSRTIVFTLTKPSGDFPNRLTMGAAAAIPKEVAGCFDGKPGLYGRYVVASGPYMIEARTTSTPARARRSSRSPASTARRR
jgi:peptide/nickel transport system substrate-binding protein